MANVIRLEPEDDERALVDRSRSGGRDAFAELYARYRYPVYNACLAQLRDPVRAEDAVQDTFLRALDNLKTFDPGKRMLPWLLSIAVHRCIDMQRRDAKVSLNSTAEGEWPEVSVQMDPTVDSVIGQETKERIERALAKLPWRQRRTVLLSAVEGWSCTDIAAMEGLSVTAAKALLHRARANLRRACRTRVLGVLPLAAFGRLRARLGARIARTSSRLDLDQYSLTASAQALTTAIVMFATATINPGAGTIGSIGVAPLPLVAAAPARHTQAGAGSTAHALRRTHGARNLANGFSTDQTARSVQHELAPTKDATPEDTQFESFAVSPGYKNDHTIFASGTVSCARNFCPVLFVTHDGGAGWTQLAADKFLGGKMLLPPTYPSDDRIYAMGPGGLQESDNGGASFDNVNPLVGDAAVSPMFAVNDPRILVGGSTVVEYWADKHLFKPAPLTAGSPVGMTIAFSPNYAKDKIIFLGGVVWSAVTHAFVGAIWRCEDSVCEQTQLPVPMGQAPNLRVSPDFSRDNTVFVLAKNVVFRSVDGGNSFDASSLPENNLATDLIFDSSSSNGVAVVYMSLTHTRKARVATTPMRMSRDWGRTWTSVPITRAGFGEGAKLVASIDRELLAAAWDRGLACSADGGLTWQSRCRAA